MESSPQVDIVVVSDDDDDHVQDHLTTVISEDHAHVATHSDADDDESYCYSK